MPSTSRANGAAGAPAAKEGTAKRWQFVNADEPKRTQDKEVLSIVRAHAMSHVRRKQRLEPMAQHQQGNKAMTPLPRHANCGHSSVHPLRRALDDCVVSGRTDTDWLKALRDMLTRLGFIDRGHPPSTNGAEQVAECDEFEQRSSDWHSDSENDIHVRKQMMLGGCDIGAPKALVGDGV